MQAGTRSVPDKSGPSVDVQERLGQITSGAARRAAPASIRPPLTADAVAIPGGTAAAIRRSVSSGRP